MCKLSLDTLEQYRFTIPNDAFESVSYQERSLYKDSLAFLYAYYNTQYTKMQQCTYSLSLYTVELLLEPYPFLVLFVPDNISIPPLFSLLVPAHILAIPLYLIFPKDALLSKNLLVALELAGVEDIFCTDFSTAYPVFSATKQGAYITSNTFTVPDALFHYTPPKLWEHAKKSVYAPLYPDALYTAPNKHTTPAHIWLYPSLTLENYYVRRFTITSKVSS